MARGPIEIHVRVKTDKSVGKMSAIAKDVGELRKLIPATKQAKAERIVKRIAGKMRSLLEAVQSRDKAKQKPKRKK